jgi:hypothetical protein
MSPMKPKTFLTILAALSLPGGAVLALAGLKETISVLGFESSQVLRGRFWVEVENVVLFSAFWSPLTTLIAVLVTAGSFRQLSPPMRWAALCLCVAALLGTMYFWGAISMVGYHV